MTEQLRHLQEMTEKPHVDIRVLPFRNGAHASPEGSFIPIDLEEPFSEIVHTERPGGAIYLEREGVDRLVRVHDRLRRDCLSAEESVAFLAALEKDLS